jgi:hypothetical protein
MIRPKASSGKICSNVRNMVGPSNDADQDINASACTGSMYISTHSLRKMVGALG